MKKVDDVKYTGIKRNCSECKREAWIYRVTVIDAPKPTVDYYRCKDCALKMIVDFGASNFFRAVMTGGVSSDS